MTTPTSPTAPDAAEALAPKEIAVRWAACVWNRDRVSAVRELIHADHPIGADGVIASFTRLHAQLQDVRATIERQLAEGSQVVTHLKLLATLSGQPIGWNAIYIHTIRDGRIADYVAVSDIPRLD
jgi:ketosteroid isomerase-like protein